MPKISGEGGGGVTGGVVWEVPDQKLIGEYVYCIKYNNLDLGQGWVQLFNRLLLLNDFML